MLQGRQEGGGSGTRGGVHWEGEGENIAVGREFLVVQVRLRGGGREGKGEDKVRTLIRFRSYDIQNVQNRGLESELREIA